VDHETSSLCCLMSQARPHLRLSWLVVHPPTAFAQSACMQYCAVFVAWLLSYCLCCSLVDSCAPIRHETGVTCLAQQLTLQQLELHNAPLTEAGLNPQGSRLVNR